MLQPKDRIIFPLDVPDYRTAMSLVEKLTGRVGLFKVGLELFIAEGPRIVDAVNDAGDTGVFLDLKLHDIPATVTRAFETAARLKPEFITVHCEQGNGFLKPVSEKFPGTKILGITLLTSLNGGHLQKLGLRPEYLNDISGLAVVRALIAKEAGCGGVVCSGLEAATIREAIGPEMIIVTPGIRPRWSLVEGDDQKRIVTPGGAIQNGADYIVVGRPIRDAKDPAEAARRLADEIESGL
ncbi:MAG: orotidine-5'-phosphate decarboxylase [Desulfatiglandaceae bacterium]